MQAHARGLTALGAEVAAYGIADKFTTADRADWELRQFQVFNPQFLRFGYSAKLGQALTQASHDIVHQHGIWLYPSIAVARWGRRTGHSFLISTQGMLEPWSLENAKWKKKFAALIFERNHLTAAACIHCSEVEVEGVRAFGLKNPIAVIPNGANLPDLSRPLRPPPWWPNDGRRVVLFLGRLHPKKGIRETLEAWARLKSQRPDVAAGWRLVIAGWDDRGNAEALVSQAATLGLDDDVLFPGPVFGDHKSGALAHANAFILASHSEGLPMAVLEAWSYALPVFMTRHCNLPEGFTSGAAIEVSTNSKELADSLGDHLAQPHLAEIGQRGRSLVAERFAWSAISRELLGVYRWVHNGGPRPACVRLD
jgi:glycosyltransferase involved in cell wall biosynthesis